MNDKEFKRWTRFQKRHPHASKLFYECHPNGIGTSIVAVAKYEGKRVIRNITDYDCW